ncbi:glycoside hydrolase [Lindgomyces ingoldianus]|uniref:Glycoside hydrolase n=1 Tax=Lindgomyces ingoldianus TaxID=673940 RepID=A0ACB6QK77_9PLEO|nr:glycoside hydrolase [Lindgomyces ingoldianus]KAF2467419.1 glycoside hydrolase [Lindgomyces ingoldianus]
MPSAPVYEDVCTVYTTVYYYASALPVPAANSTVYMSPSPLPYSSSSTPCAESSTPVLTPTKEAYTPPPVYSAPPSSYVAPVYSSSPVYSAPAKPSTSAASKPKPSKTPSYGGAGGRIVTKGEKWAITYTPYTSSGECKSSSEVQGDISKIAGMGFTTIRSYSTDCGVFENVVPACQAHGLKVIYGIFLEAGGKGGKGPFSDYANQQLEEIKNKAPKDSVAMVIVGNESLFNHYCTAEELAAYIDYVRETLHGAGFPSDIAITTTEPVDVWENKGAALCSHIDVFACQVHPFFTAKVTASGAGNFAKEQLEKAAAVCPEAAAKGKYITEIGWPKSGEANGNAIPGYSEQKTAIKSIMEQVGKESCLFSYQDDKWKAPGAFGVEQYFGCSDAL